MKSLFNFKLITALFTVVVGQLALAQQHQNADAPSVHGMLLFGKDKIYLSHLPMFHSPHDYQVLLEVDIPALVKEKYLNSTKSDPNQTVYTIVPELFSLPEIVKNKTSFKAQLFKGHFERGGKPITSSVEFKISNVLYFKKFSPNGIKPKLSSYILIGSKKEQYFVHTVIAKPDFDYIAKVEINDAVMTKKLTKEGHLMIQVNSPNKTPLEEGKSFKGSLTNNDAAEVKFHITKGLYLEFGDLSH